MHLNSQQLTVELVMSNYFKTSFFQMLHHVFGTVKRILFTDQRSVFTDQRSVFTDHDQ